MNKVSISTILLVLLYSRLIVFKINAEEYTKIDYDQEATTAMTYNADYEVEESIANLDDKNDAVINGSDKSDTEINDRTRNAVIDHIKTTDFESYCESCNQSDENSEMIKICVNYFSVDLSFSPTIIFLWESDWFYNNGELTNIICAVSHNHRITMSYYEYEGSSLKKRFTSTSVGSVQSYIKLEQRNSPAYIECQRAPLDFAVASSQFENEDSAARLFLIPWKTSRNLIKVNGLTLPVLCTNFRQTKYVYEYYAVMNEPLNIILRPYSKDIHCNTNGYKLFNSVTNITSFGVGLVFNNSQSVFIHCYRKSNITRNQIDHYKTFEVVVSRYQKLFTNAKIWVEGIQWQSTLGMYSTNHGIDRGTSNTRTTKVIKYLYHGEELKLTCYTYYEVANWAYSDKVIYKQINSVKCIKTPKGCLYTTTSSFVVKEIYSNVEIKCTSSDGNVFIVELIRDKLLERNVVASATDESSNVVQTITISVTVLMAIMVVVLGFTVYKVAQVRNKRKQERIAASTINYEPKYAKNIYESIKYENPNRVNQPQVDISKRPPIPLPSEKREDKQSSVDISQRPPLPLPFEEENQPYKHYDTPYEYRLFRFGRRTGPPNRGRTLKQIQ